MKSKILSYSQSQNHHASAASNNSINSSVRNRNSTKYHANRYSTSSLTPPRMGKNIDNDICNNNIEEVNVGNDCLIASSEDKDTNGIVEDIKKSFSSLDLRECNLNGNSSEDGNASDNNADLEDECRKSCVSMLSENRTNLIVNYLPQNMSQEEMRIFFGTIGEVESCKLIRDKSTGQSLSYGFVNYQDSKDASNAIQKFNGHRLQNKNIKVSLARPSSETIKGANLYICGLPKSMSQIELEQLFSQYGTIITCRILVDNMTGNSKGVAFIRFDQRQEAENAIRQLNEYTPPNGTEPITVKLANTPFNINNSSNSQLSMAHSLNGDYVVTSTTNNTSIPPSNGMRSTMPNMRSMLTTCSDIIPVRDGVLQNNGHPSPTIMGPEYLQSSVPTIPNNHQIPFPTAHIVCPPQIHPLAAYPMSYPCLQSIAGPQGPSTMQGNALVPINGNHPSPQFISIDPVTASSQIIDSNLYCLFVYNLGPETKEGSLWQTFGPYGAVNSVNIARDPVTGKCRGLGFVTMPNYHEAYLAAQQLNGNPLENRALQIVMNHGLKMPHINQYVLPSMTP